MDKEGVEEDDVSFLHLHVHQLAIYLLVGLYSEVGLVHRPLLRIRVLVVVKPPLVALGQDVQASVLLRAILQGCPCGHDAIGRTEREVSQILMVGVSRTNSHPRRLIDEHRMH